MFIKRMKNRNREQYVKKYTVDSSEVMSQSALIDGLVSDLDHVAHELPD